MANQPAAWHCGQNRSACSSRCEHAGLQLLLTLSVCMQLLSTGADALMKLWSVRTSECTATFDAHEGKVRAWRRCWLSAGAAMACAPDQLASARLATVCTIFLPVHQAAMAKHRQLQPCAATRYSQAT